MACTIDIGEEKNIHPAEKFVVARRLAYRAFAETYGIKGINYKSPVFSKMVIKDTLAILSFDNVALGLSTFGSSVCVFQFPCHQWLFVQYRRFACPFL
ncbi:MAG TPA: hypothetical protein VIK10_03100 [Prolixibacteraceae bacterium]